MGENVYIVNSTANLSPVNSLISAPFLHLRQAVSYTYIFIRYTLLFRHKVVSSGKTTVTDMGARMHGQGKGVGTCPWKCYKVFCTSVVTVEHSVDQLFMHHFHNFSSASGGIAPRPPPRFHPWTPLGDFRLHTH